jgi:hypothetical protein
MKKTLITKLSLDMTLANDEQIEAMKSFMRASFAQSGMDIDFEVRTEGTENPLDRWLELIRGEFNAADAPSDDQVEENDDGVETVIRVDSAGKIIEFPGHPEGV